MSVYSRKNDDLPESTAPNAIFILVVAFLGFGAGLIFTTIAPLLDLNPPVILTLALGALPAALLAGALLARGLRHGE